MKQNTIEQTEQQLSQTRGTLPGFGFLLRIIVFVITSWILVHIFALLGVFVALAYPLWYLLAPQSTVCLLCRFHIRDYKCPLCKRITKPEDPKVPSSLSSAILNGFLILFFSLISVGFIYVERIILNNFGIPATPKTVTFVIPDKGQYKIDEIFSMDINVKGIEVPVNAVQADIKFDQERVEIIDIVTDYSFAEVFIQKSISNDLGYARLTGGLPDPGYYGKEGIFGTVLFRGKSAGIVSVEFLPTSLVLANDKNGTNVLKDYAKASYLILPEKLTPDEVSLQNDLLSEEVLGTMVDKTKLEFYDESEADVLGIESELLDQESTETSSEEENPWNFWHILEMIDSFVLSFWNWVASLFE
ncbi:MAG: cohesin domain-containing protein [bacterium]